jgi:hypothetical protein
MKRHLGRWQWFAAACLGAVFAMSPSAANAKTPVSVPVSAPAATEQAPADGIPENANTRQLHYAEREAKSPNAAQFKGGYGNGIYISSGAVIVILVVVLVVVLL